MNVKALKWVLDELGRWIDGQSPATRVPTGVDPAAFLEVVTRNRLAPLMNLRMELMDGGKEWEEVQRSLMAAYQANLVRGLQALSGVSVLTASLAERGVTCLALRGVFAGGELYGDIGARTFGDIDLLIPAAQRRMAFDVARGLGYRHYPRWLSPTLIERVHLHWRMDSPQFGLPCELHWAVDHRYRLQNVDYDAIFQDAVTCSVHGYEWMQPSAIHQFIITCMHLNKHGRLDPRDVEKNGFVEHLAETGELRRWVDILAMRKRCARELNPREVSSVAKEWGGSMDIDVALKGAERLESYSSSAVSVRPPLFERRVAAAGRFGFRNICVQDLVRFVFPEKQWFVRHGESGAVLQRVRRAVCAVGQLACDGMSALGDLLVRKPLGCCVLAAMVVGALPAFAHEFGDDYGDTAASAKALTLNSNYVGRIEIDVDQDWFSFTAANSLKEYVVTVTTGTLWNSTAGMVGPDGRGALAKTDSVASASARVTWIHLGPPAMYFVRVGGFSQFTTGTYSIAVSERGFTDQDGDGMPDTWESSTMGSTNLPPGGDLDHDGVDNLHEFLAGTDPANSNSFLRLESFTGSGDQREISWSAAPYRTYDIEVSTNLAMGGWMRVGTVTNLDLLDTVMFDDSNTTLPAVRFYRIKCLY